MKVIIISKPDIASCNIFENLLNLRDWKEEGEFLTNPLYRYDDYCIAEINDRHIFHDNVDLELIQVLGEKPKCVIYASRHRSESGRRSLTIHPIGNFGKAEVGGREQTLVPSSPQMMTQALRILKKKAKKLDYAVSFEATHHGPYLQTPTFFIEIGSDENAWRDEEAAKVIAETILETHTTNYPVGIGVGGGHYAPRITDVVLERKISFGHIVPTYAVSYVTPEMANQVVGSTANAKKVYFHRSHLKGKQYRTLKAVFSNIGISPIRSSDLELLDRE